MERQQHGKKPVQEVKSGDLLGILSNGYEGMSGHHTYLGPAACELIERVRQGDEVAQYGLVALAESGKLVAQAAVVELGDGYVPQTVLQNARKVVKQVRRWRTDGDPQPAARACKRIRATGNFGESASVRPREYVAQPPARTRKRKLGQANLGDHPSPGLVCQECHRLIDRPVAVNRCPLCKVDLHTDCLDVHFLLDHQISFERWNKSTLEAQEAASDADTLTLSCGHATTGVRSSRPTQALGRGGRRASGTCTGVPNIAGVCERPVCVGGSSETCSTSLW